MRNDHCYMFNVPIQHKISHVKNYVNLLGVIKARENTGTTQLLLFSPQSRRSRARLRQQTSLFTLAIFASSIGAIFFFCMWMSYKCSEHTAHTHNIHTSSTRSLHREKKIAPEWQQKLQM